MTLQTRLSGFRPAFNIVLISLIAGVPRIIGALTIRKEPFGDAYCYIEQVTSMRGKMVTRVFALENLYSFWLPLYQLFCSIVSLVVNEPVYVTRLVAALAGAGVCVLVYLCSSLLTSDRKVSLFAALAIALSPFHLQYSSAAMTDIPHALVVMGCLYFVLTERWTLAACVGAAACMIRFDSWMLVVLVPAIQLVRLRKVPVLSILILAAAPAFWLFICWNATGNPLASFQAHDDYVLMRLTAHPEFNQVTLSRTWIDANRLAYAVNVAVLAGCAAALWLLVRQWREWRRGLGPRAFDRVTDLLVCLLFFFGYLSFIALAYFTKNQSDIWPRYGLLLFALGLPVLAYTARQVVSGESVLAKGALAAVLVVGAVQFKNQATDLAHFLGSPDRAQAIASYLSKEYKSDPSIRIFCDSPEVRVRSGIPGDHFYHSFFDGVPKDREGFVSFLRTKGIKFLMIPEEDETSTPSQLFPPGRVKDAGVFEDVIPPPDERRADSLYRVRDVKSPAG
jgi:hypothetical protein